MTMIMFFFSPLFHCQPKKLKTNECPFNSRLVSLAFSLPFLFEILT